MKLYILVIDGKIKDAVSGLGAADQKDKINDYFEVDGNIRDYIYDDTWDDVNKLSLKDSPHRNKEQPKSLEERIIELEDKVKKLEEIK